MKKKILILAGDQYEDLELHYPRLRLLEENHQVVIAGLEKNHIYKSKHGYDIKSDSAFSEVITKDFQALIIPGGMAPDKLRAIDEVLHITRQFHQEKKTHCIHLSWWMGPYFCRYFERNQMHLLLYN